MTDDPADRFARHLYVVRTTDDQRSEQFRIALQGLVDVINAALPQLADSFRQISEGLASIHHNARQAGLIPAEPPDDPMARALHLRRHRNTGPAPRRQRPPRYIGDRRCW